MTDLLTYFTLLTHLLTYLLMPSGKHNLRARDLISSLIKFASSRDVPFHQPQQLQCLHRGELPLYPFVPILSSPPSKVISFCRHVMASV